MNMKTQQETQIYLSPPHMSIDARNLLIDAFDSNWIAPVGPDLTSFENEFAEYVGSKYAVAVSSGTAAVHLALRVLGIDQTDHVPVSSLTFVAPVNAIRYQGAQPVMIDSDWKTWNMCPKLLDTAIKELSACGNTPKAIVVVDALGQCADFRPIREICSEYGIVIVEDAAEALGATYYGDNAGRLGDIGCFSFNGNKMITTSSGGMLVTDRKEWADEVRHLATQARDDAPHYEHSEVGYNYRMSNLLAAVGRGQLRVLEQRVSRRREIFRWYRDQLSGLPGIEMIPEFPTGESSCWLTCVIIDPEEFGCSREEVRVELAQEKIESRPCWKPMHMQPLFETAARYGGDVSSAIFERGLCLPSGSSMSSLDLQRVLETISRIQKSF